MGCISVRFTTLRGKRCYRNDCNIMTPRYGKIVFISDLRLYTGKQARTISPTIVCVLHGRSRLNRAQCKPFRSLFPSVIKSNQQVRRDDRIFFFLSLYPANESIIPIFLSRFPFLPYLSTFSLFFVFFSFLFFICFRNLLVERI